MPSEHRARRFKTLMSNFEGELARQQLLSDAYVRSLAERNPLWTRITDTLLAQNQVRIDSCFAQMQALVAEEDED